jgi:hypothetical protein
MRAPLIVSVFSACALAACQPPASGNRPVSIESMLACQQAARARGYPEPEWEVLDVAADPAPAGAPSVKGRLVRGAETRTFSCAFDASDALVSVTVQ